MRPSAGAPAFAVLCILLLASLPPPVRSANGAAGGGTPEGGQQATAVQPRDVPPPQYMTMNVSFDSRFYLKGDTATVSGWLVFDNGVECSGARVNATLWGGTLLGAAVASPMGNFSISFTVENDPGNYTVNVTAVLTGFSASTMLILAVAAQPNSPPVIFDVLATPVNVTPEDDVVVCATAIDDHGVRMAWLVYRVAGTDFTRLVMNNTGAGRYISSIPRQPALSLVQYYIEAYDGVLTTVYPPGAPSTTLAYNVGTGETAHRGWLRMAAFLNCTECFFGRQFLITGFIQNDTGAAVANASVTAAFVEPAAPGNWTSVSDEGGIFRMSGTAPQVSGSYTLRVDCAAGGLSNSTSVGLGVLDSLTVSIYFARLSVETAESVRVTGHVVRSDGSGAANASVRLNFEGSVAVQFGRTDDAGFYNMSVRAPRSAGMYVLSALAVYNGVNATGESQLYVREPANATPGDQGRLAVMAIGATAFTVLIRRRKYC